MFLYYSVKLFEILFGHFFKDAGGVIVLGMVFLFALAWLIKARPHNIPKKYQIIVFDVFGKESRMDGMRTEFKNHDVAWSFMKSYTKDHTHLCTVLLWSQNRKDSAKKIIFKYI